MTCFSYPRAALPATLDIGKTGVKMNDSIPSFVINSTGKFQLSVFCVMKSVVRYRSTLHNGGKCWFAVAYNNVLQNSLVLFSFFFRKTIFMNNHHLFSHSTLPRFTGAEQQEFDLAFQNLRCIMMKYVSFPTTLSNFVYSNIFLTIQKSIPLNLMPTDIKNLIGEHI